MALETYNDQQVVLTDAEVAFVLSGYPYLDCRAQGHDWPRMKPGVGFGPISRHPATNLVYIERDLTCRGCGSVRHERKISSRGRWVTPDDPFLLGAPYTYAPGYLLALGERPTKAQCGDFRDGQALPPPP